MVRISFVRGAMEVPKFYAQVIENHHHDHVGTGGQTSRITMSMCRSDQGSPQRIRSRRGDVRALKWPQRRRLGAWGCLLLLIVSIWIIPASAVFIEFQNCLSEAYQHDSPPLLLQFVPKFVDAVFNTTDPNHTLKVTVWGNVTGSGPLDPVATLPPASDTAYWNNTEITQGKIADNPDPTAPDPKLTTLFNKVNVLTYQPWSSQPVDFCSQLVNASCPLGPVFNPSADLYQLPSFGFSNNFSSTYAFTSFTATLLVKNGDTDATDIGCISANITPDLGSSLVGILKFLPLVVLICVGIATAFAGVYSPWGTTDIFRWTSNYGRDADLLRLVTPGFGDCLQYIQFIALTGGLTLNYPGVYQPVVSNVSWSALMFNQSFVSNGAPAQSLVDGIYVTRGTYGLDILRQLVGMSAVDDVWAGMVIWLLVIIGIVLILTQIGFLLRWGYRHINNTHEEDLRAKNLPFSMGNVIRIVFNYFLLPIVALSMFQLVVASESPTFAVGLAVVMLVVIVGFAAWLLFLIAYTRPKSYLFDDLPTVLLYGSLYNTYSDDAAPFALVPVVLTFVRGIAIGAVQPSGIAQLVLLAICEVITVLTLHAFRPFHSPTSMNAYHTFFAVLRFSSILLMVSFAPSLGVTEGPKGWIGYTILLLHAIVLIFGFLLNAIQTIVEVAARLAGAGGDQDGAARGGLAKVFGMRQLSRRLPRRDAGSRQSQLSNAAMLDAENDAKGYMMDGGRRRSQSAGSTGILLKRQSTGLESNGADSFGLARPHQVGSGNSSHTPTTAEGASTFSFLPSAAAPSGLGRNRGPILGLATADADPYYRPPRARRPTLETYSPGAKSRGSGVSGDWPNKRWSEQDAVTTENNEPFDGPSISGRATPQQLEGGINELRRSKADYTTREVDFYYRVRGPALNANIPSRKTRTGPADPTGIPASAVGWFKGLLGGKTKEKGKGFEVVRSSRMPPGMSAGNGAEGETPPEGIPVATGGVRNGPIDSDDESVPAERSRATNATGPESKKLVSPLGSEDEDDSLNDSGGFVLTRISDIPPSLPGIELDEGGIELPSRFPSKATSKASARKDVMTDVPLVPSFPTEVPSVPRKSSRRKSQSVELTPARDSFQQHRYQSSLDASRLPFGRTSSDKPHSITSAVSSVASPEETGLERNTSSRLGNFSAAVREERPASVGYVHQHNIRTVNPSENPEFLGASAEVVDGHRSGASSMENPQR